MSKFRENAIVKDEGIKQYFTAIPNVGAGIGHQMANWIAGYWWAKQFGLSFAHIPFSSSKWETFLGFGLGEPSVEELIQQGYRKVKIPLFKEKSKEDLQIIRSIIKAYTNKKVVFVCGQDQFYKDQYGVINDIQQKFYQAPSRKDDCLIFEENAYNVAIHVRRGDIVAGQNKIDNHTMRWLTNEYFETVLKNTLDFINTTKKVNIYLFSQGDEEEFKEFKKFPNLIFCLDMGAMDSFLHMTKADVLITSKSSFSYKPALLNKGIKVVPKDFWHGYPKDSSWVLVGDDGNIIKN
ncbi:O-fucosyltransferase family protein [Ochrovirga pacifica]|uniref:hypothetical protein n=1 Tax=Ochrovirga pacifica TaxID=1042376 RepID=UPI0002559E02|nr:hypothetical protein [Ochrovirga pacifica]